MQELPTGKFHSVAQGGPAGAEYHAVSQSAPMPCSWAEATLRLGREAITKRSAVPNRAVRLPPDALAGGLSTMLCVARPNIAAADDKDLAQTLRAGGLVIVVRHGATFADQAETDPLNPDNVAAQRNLNDKGKALAKDFGDAFRRRQAQECLELAKVATDVYAKRAMAELAEEFDKAADALDPNRPLNRFSREPRVLQD
jgi:hypothetical protein